MAQKQFNKGDVIFREGDEGDSFYQIESGKVDVVVNYGKEDEAHLTQLVSGDFFGEMAVLEGNRRSAAVIAAEDTSLKEVSPAEIDAYFTEEPEKIIALMKHLSGRIRALTNDFNEVNAILNEQDPAGAVRKDESIFAKIKKFLAGVSETKPTFQEKVEADHAKGYSVKVETLPKGTVIFREGDDGTCMYDIHFGRVGIYTGYGTEDEKMLTDLYANRFFGEMGMIDGEVRSATAVVLEDNTTLEIIYPEDLADLMKNNPPKVDMILQYLCRRLRRLTADYTEACRKLAASAE